MSDLEIRELFKRQLNTLLEANNETQLQLANALGVSRSTVCDWCSGNKVPRINRIDEIAKHFGVNRSDLLENKRVNQSADSELEEYLEELKNRPELKMLFDVTRGCTKEDVEKAARIIEAALGR